MIPIDLYNILIFWLGILDYLLKYQIIRNYQVYYYIKPVYIEITDRVTERA